MDINSSSITKCFSFNIRLLKDLFLVGKVDKNFLTTLETLCFSPQHTEKTDSHRVFTKEVSQLIQFVITGEYTVSKLLSIDSM